MLVTGYPCLTTRKKRRRGHKHTKKAAALIMLIGILCGMLCFSSAEEATPEESAPYILLEPAELALNKGAGKKVSPSLKDAPKGVRIQKTEWTSSDPEVAVFRNNAIYGAGGGQAVMTCTATLTDGTTLEAECPVTVTVPVTGIRAADKNLTVMAGDTFMPEIQITPEDASNRNILMTSSDEQILQVEEDGQVRALAEGKATLTVQSEADPDKKVRIPVTVTRRIGKTDMELTFLGVPWESDCETSVSLLKEKGFVTEEERKRSRCTYTGTAWHWPENDLLFARTSAWRTLPVAFTDRQTGAGRCSITPQKTVGGYLPQIATLVFLNGLDAEGKIDPESSRLIGVYFSFDNRHEPGTEIFRELLNRLEGQYGEFNRYLPKDFKRYYGELYEEIRDVMDGAKEYSIQELGNDLYLQDYAICTIRGAKNSGIMLNMDNNGNVTLFYGRADAEDLIRELQECMAEDSEILEDAGV